MDIAARLQRILKEQNLTSTAFASSIFVTKSFVSQLLHGKANLSEKTAFIICEKYNYNIKWLLYGQEPVYNSPAADTQTLLNRIVKMSKSEQKLIAEFIEFLDSIKNPRR